MIYDDKISNTVELSKILDYFIETNESFDVIQNFLDGYSYTEKTNIIIDSINFYDTFNIFYFSKLKVSNVEWFFSNIFTNDRIINKYEYFLKLFYWQILRNSKSDILNMRIRNIMKITKIKTDNYPYRRINGSIVRELESRIFTDDNYDNIVEKINNMYVNDFKEYINSLENSMYLGMILNPEFFIRLDITKQYIFINSINGGEISRLIDNFLLYRLLTFNIDVRIKHDIFKKSYNIDYGYDDNTKFNSFIDGCCFEEILIKLSTLGDNDFLRKLIIRYIKSKDVESLIKLYDYDKELLSKNFDICDLILDFKTKFKY